MLTRQRRLRKAQEQVKKASSKRLPPKGGSSGSSRTARNQRATTARTQAASNQRVVARGIRGFIRRGQAMDKADAAARGTRSSGTRTAGAGGGIARRPESRPATRGRTAGLSRRGALTRSGSSAASNARIEPVRVRDVTNQTKGRVGGSSSKPSISSSQQGPQSPTRRQAATAKANAAARGTTGPNRVGQPAGSANRVYGANRVNAAVNRAVNATRSARIANVKNGNLAIVGLTAANAIQDKLLSPKALERKRANEINKNTFYASHNPLKPKPAQAYGPGGSPSGSGQGQAQQRKPATAKQVSALTDKGGIFNMNGTGNVKPRPKPASGSGSNSSASTKRSAPAKPKPRDTRNDEYHRLRVKANKTGKAEDRKSAEKEGLSVWAKANPKLAARLKEQQKKKKERASRS